ncbi:ankyrin repeat domain-containing protein, partial [bacterium]|nr:ankyrin repeat domain-containing protein [bacterium]
MKLLITTIAAVVLVGCGESQPPEPPTAKAPDISIHEAARQGKIEAVKQHLDAGTDVNAKGDYDFTPLHKAAGAGHKEVAKLLVANGADVNAKSVPSGVTPLQGATYEGHKETVELLIVNGADVNAKYLDGDRPLDVAERHPEIADLLRKHGGKTRSWFKAEESIHAAASSGHIEAVKQHVDAGSDVNAKDDVRSFTSLHYAASQGHKEITELLISKGADVNAKDSVVGGETPLDLAKKEWMIDTHRGRPLRGSPDTKAAKKETADLLRKHGGKHSSIHRAAVGGDAEGVKEFLDAGTDVN